MLVSKSKQNKKQSKATQSNSRRWSIERDRGQHSGHSAPWDASFWSCEPLAAVGCSWGLSGDLGVFPRDNWRSHGTLPGAFGGLGGPLGSHWDVREKLGKFLLAMFFVFVFQKGRKWGTSTCGTNMILVNVCGRLVVVNCKELMSVLMIVFGRRSHFFVQW